MHVTLTFEGHVYDATPSGAVATVPIACPHCKAAAPMAVRGGGIRETTHDTYIADARCVQCGEPMGTLRAKVDTIFGIEEDERVLNSGCRVY